MEMCVYPLLVTFSRTSTSNAHSRTDDVKITSNAQHPNHQNKQNTIMTIA